MVRGVVALLVSGASAGAADWGEDLARKFGGRLDAIDQELARIDADLVGLPVLPRDDQGGSGGFASLHPEPRGEFPMVVEWGEPAPVDFVALVPARRYEIDGLNRQYGLPDDFRVELTDAQGEVVTTVAEVTDTWSHPVRGGHPFVFRLSPPVKAAGLRIVAQQLPGDGDRFAHAWSEAFVFSRGVDLAAGTRVGNPGGQNSAAPWQWAPEFLVDRQTPLGLPEMPAGEHRNIGWLSRGRERADEVTWLELDLSEVRRFDRLRLIPARRPTSDLPSGFGFPQTFKVKVGEQRDDFETNGSKLEVSMRNPGHNPVEVKLGELSGRFVRIEATRLWKPFESYPAFFAMSEVELWNGPENVALGARVRSPDGMGNVIASGARFWSTVSLCDGYGPDGKLVPTQEWLAAIDRRLALETERHELRREAGRIIADWRRAVFWVLGLLGGVGGVALVVLPLRYRIRERQQLRAVRERIAGDLHDEVGSNLGSIQMFADLAEGRTGPSKELSRIQRIAAETVSAVRDIVWLLRPQGGARIGTVEHLRETASIMLERLEWKFTANEAAWQTELSDEQNRHLFLYFREALHNILRHSEAKTVTIHADEGDGVFALLITDDGVGIPEAKRERPATLRALRQRAEALRAEFGVESKDGDGTALHLAIPLRKSKRSNAGIASKAAQGA
ncbi:histidine kinase [Verrucomicrobiaceae bacterium E54]|nr:histidine kinase [Verrucomicrobiaceae bacterium E54]